MHVPTQQALDCEGSVWAWGLGINGQLGLNSATSRTQPARIDRSYFHGAAVVMVAGGSSHSAAVSESAEVYLWGCGADGRLGTGDENRRLSPTRINFSYPAQLAGGRGGREDSDVVDGCDLHCAEGGVTGGSSPYQGAGRNAGLVEIVTVAAGCRHSGVVSVEGCLWLWGSGDVFVFAWRMSGEGGPERREEEGQDAGGKPGEHPRQEGFRQSHHARQRACLEPTGICFFGWRSVRARAACRECETEAFALHTYYGAGGACVRVL